MIVKRTFLNVIVASLILFGLTNCTSNTEKRLVKRIEKLDAENQLIVQLAELQIDPKQLKQYMELLEEGIRTSVETEPGVLSLYVMADMDNLNRITVVEVYEN